MLNSKGIYRFQKRFGKIILIMGWLMGLEPTTTGITIQGSTN
tara:strand:- start:3503 stop:3628 length:126 start_codon:yes stop_codon:yes gene_type:complete